jgi:hypothetical protein
VPLIEYVDKGTVIVKADDASGIFASVSVNRRFVYGSVFELTDPDLDPTRLPANVNEHFLNTTYSENFL